MTEKRIFITQSNYIPWKGYFDSINRVDEFVFYDDVQYTRRDWRNRQKIKTADGLQWLSIPVLSKNHHEKRICDIRIRDQHWQKKHLKTLLINYQKAPFFTELKDFVVDLYQNIDSANLCEINYYFIKRICEFLGIQPKFKYSFDFKLPHDKTERVIELCRQLHASHLFNSIKARDVLNESLIKEAGIKITYIDYLGYPEYPQLYPPFEHYVSILDLLFNTGKQAKKYLLSFKQDGE